MRLRETVLIKYAAGADGRKVPQHTVTWFQAGGTPLVSPLASAKSTTASHEEAKTPRQQLQQQSLTGLRSPVASSVTTVDDNVSLTSSASSSTTRMQNSSPSIPVYDSLLAPANNVVMNLVQPLPLSQSLEDMVNSVGSGSPDNLVHGTHSQGQDLGQNPSTGQPVAAPTSLDAIMDFGSLENLTMTDSSADCVQLPGQSFLMNGDQPSVATPKSQSLHVASPSSTTSQALPFQVQEQDAYTSADSSLLQPNAMDLNFGDSIF